MADLNVMIDALQNAHKAGDKEAARKIADAINAMQQQPAPKQAAPFEDPGLGKSILIGAGKTFVSVGDGMRQIYYGATGNDKEQAKLKTKVEDERALYKPLAEARPFATAIGEALPSMVIPVGGGATAAATIGRTALAGALPAALEYGSVADRAKGAALGAGAALAVPGLVATGRTGKAFLEPLYKGGQEAIIGRTLNRVAGENAPAVMSRLKGASSLIPGSMPTAAEVAESGGVAALQRMAAQANPEAYATRAMEQSGSRLNALRGIAGDDAAMAAAKAARADASGPLFQQATKAVYTVDDRLAGLLNRPAVRQAMERAKALAENNGRRFTFGVEPSNAFSGLGVKSTKTQQITGQGLQDLKMAMDEMLSDPASGFSGKAGDAVKNLRGQLLDWMEGVNPVFKQARTTHADMSRPINQMEVGQHLLDKVAPALSDFGALGQETGAQFARAMRNADQTVKTATKFKGAKGMAEVMTPQQMATINAIGQDLARKANAQNLGRGGGSDTFQKLAMDNIAAQSGMPRAVEGLLSLPGLSRATNWLYRDADQKMQGLLADALLSPASTAGLMEKGSKGLLAESPKARELLKQIAFRNSLIAPQLLYSPAE